MPPASSGSCLYLRRSLGLELIAAQSAIDRDHRAGDIARPRRGQENGEHGEVFGLTPEANGNFLFGKSLAVILRIVAPELLAHDASWRNAVDGDAVLADLARQTLGPRMDRSLGRKCRVQTLRLRLAGDVDDAAPAALDHLRQQCMRDLPVAGEIERNGLIPGAVGRIDRKRPDRKS